MNRTFKTVFMFILLVCLCLSMQSVSFADDVAIPKVLTTINPNIPIAMANIGDTYAATSTPGASVISIVWYDANGTPDNDTFDATTYTLAITLSANPGYYFTEDMSAYINNTPASVNRASDGSSVTITRQIAPTVYAPTVYKNPIDENIVEGSYASFNSTASEHYQSTSWQLCSPDGKLSYDLVDNGIYVDGVSVTYSHLGTTITLHNVPATMNGWKVRCGFVGLGGTTYSKYAYINVKSAAPTPSPTPEPTPSPTPTPEPTPEVTEAPQTDELEKNVSELWSFDSTDHWHTVEGSDEITALEAHDLKLSADSSKYVCSVCGYSINAVEMGSTDIEPESVSSESGSSVNPLIYIFAALISVSVIILVIELAVAAQQAKKSKHSKHSKHRR